MSRVGWLLVCLTIVFLISVFLAVDRHSHSVSDTLYGIFPYFVSSLMTLYCIASRLDRFQDESEKAIARSAPLPWTGQVSACTRILE